MPILKADKQLIEGFNSLRKPDTHHAACMAPSNSMFIYPDGYVVPCCHSKDYFFGKYPEKSLHDIWFSGERKRMQHEMEQYNYDLGCEGCFKTLSFKNYEGVSALRFDQFEVKKYPSNIEFQLHNMCNLECVMCSGVLSSSIRKNREGLPPLPMLYNEAFVDELTEFIPHLTHTTFSGGESFMIKIYYDIWDKIIELNPDCSISVITNGSVMNERVKGLLSKGNFNITISIDAFDKKIYEAIRKNANYDLLIENLNSFSAMRLTANVRLTLNFCPMPYNWKLIPDFVTRCNDLNCDYYFSIVYLPFPDSLLSLSAEELDVIEEYLLENEPGNFTNPVNRKRYHAFIKNVQGWKKDVTGAVGKSISYERFLEDCNKKIEEIFEVVAPTPMHLDSQRRINAFVLQLKDKLDFDAMHKNLLEKDSILRMLEETGKRNDKQATDGLIYFFGKKQVLV